MAMETPPIITNKISKGSDQIIVPVAIDAAIVATIKPNQVDKIEITIEIKRNTIKTVRVKLQKSVGNESLFHHVANNQILEPSFTLIFMIIFL